MTSDTGEARQLAAILRSVAEAIIAVAPGGQITLANPAAARLFELEAPQLIDRSLASLHPTLGTWLDRARSEPADGPLVFSLELRSGHFFAATLSPVRGEAEPVTGWVLVLQEVTHLKKAEEWKTEAIQAATHDLRNPLNLMNGALNLLRDSLREPTPEQRECVAMLRSGLDRMGGLVEQVLNLDQVGRSDPHLAGIDLAHVAQQVADEFRLAAQDKGIDLSFEGQTATGRVLGDESWLHRAVANLVSNALKYTPRGGRVRVRYSENGGQALCEVSDTGAGIPASAQARLFERFYRVPGEATRRSPGTGLGLAIVKAIVERHSGRVWVSSEENKGSTFAFAVPLTTGAR